MATRDQISSKSREYYQNTRAKKLDYAREYRNSHKSEIADWKKTYRLQNLEKLKEKDRKYRAANRSMLNRLRQQRYAADPDRYLARNREWAESNVEKANAIKRKWVLKNREKASAAGKKWRSNNPAKRAEMKLRRRARIARNPAHEVSDDFLQRLYGLPCVACGSEDNISADHIIPVARGGEHSESNLQPLCGSCNSSKRDLTMTEWTKAKRSRASED